MTSDKHEIDLLESEIRELRPKGVSDSLRGKIGFAVERELSVATTARILDKESRRSLYWVAAAIGTAAVVLVAASVWIATRDDPGREEIVKPDIDVPIHDGDDDSPVPNSAPDAPVDRPRPTMLAYTLAMNSSDTDLEDLLDYHAESLLSRTSEGNLSWSDAAKRFDLRDEP